MSKGLSQMSRHERQQAIERRLKMSEAARGLGYWAAVDAKARMKLVTLPLAKEEK